MDGVKKAMEEYCLDNTTYKKICDILLHEMEKGLGHESNASAAIKMFPTYVRGLPDGSEIGNFLALDLGGTNFRVLGVTINGKEVQMQNKIYPISQDLMVGSGTELFDYIADCIESFTTSHNIQGSKIPLGFTFSFPLKQEGLAVGKLVRWTKGFTCEGVEGEDVVRLLHEAIARKPSLDVQCVAVLNDTVGCLMSCAFANHDTEIGVILGTGTNACYMEKLDRVETWDGDNNEPKQVIINTEWGAFGDNGVLDFIRTQVDKDIDQTSLNPGRQLYEKMISGMYMGEIARQAVVQCAKKGLILNGEIGSELATEGKFYTKYVSEIEADTDESGGYPKIQQVMEELGTSTVSVDDCKNIQYICSVVSSRAAYLASAGIVTLLNRINKKRVTVAVDGSLYRYHPHFHNLMMEKIQELILPDIQFDLMLSEDGSGKGAALVAAVAHRLSQQ